MRFFEDLFSFQYPRIKFLDVYGKRLVWTYFYKKVIRFVRHVETLCKRSFTYGLYFYSSQSFFILFKKLGNNFLL